MSLGERICTLRKAVGLSQSDMAERLCVSRQSVSKWETDASVPELEKLIFMAELFNVSLDELVRGEHSVPSDGENSDTNPSCSASPEREAKVPRPQDSAFPPRKIVGIVLLSLGFLTGLIFILLTGYLESLLYCLPFLLCGLICLFVKRPTLYCFWVLWLLIAVYMRYASGVRFWWAVNPFIYSAGLQVQFIVAWALFLPLIALFTVSIARLIKYIKAKKNC